MAEPTVGVLEFFELAQHASMAQAVEEVFEPGSFQRSGLFAEETGRLGEGLRV